MVMTMMMMMMIMMMMMMMDDDDNGYGVEDGSLKSLQIIRQAFRDL